MNEVTSIKEKSERLYALRRQLGEIDEAHKKATEELKAERDKLQAELVADMEQLGVASLKVASGDTFTKAIRRSAVVVNPVRALEWAKEHGAISIDSRIMAQKVKDGVELPDAFKLNETAYISVRRAKQADQSSNNAT